MGSLQILNPSLQLRKLVYDLRRLRFCRATTIEILKPTLLSCGVISEASVCKFICLCGVWSVSAASGKFRLRLLVNDFLNEPEPEASWSHHSAVIKCWKFNLVQKEQGLYRWTGSTWELVGVSIRSVAVRTLEEKRFDQAVGTESDRWISVDRIPKTHLAANRANGWCEHV